MKKAVKTALCSVLAICMAAGFCSCSLFAAMREYSLKASQVEIIPTPEDEALFAEFNAALALSAADAIKMNASTGYDVKNTAVTNDNGTAGLLDKASGTLNKLILANKPGAQSTDTEPADLSGTMLENFDAAASLSYTTSRNTANEAVTDENGEEVTNEAGEVVRETKIKDNFAKYAFLFYNDEVVEETHTDENGGNVPEVTERTLADAAAIEAVFGASADKAAVLAKFDAIKDYFRVNDYSFEYDTCRVSAETDLSTDHISAVSFEKVMKVTASVTGAGAFEACGELTVTFDLIKTDTYSFTYAQIEE